MDTFNFLQKRQMKVVFNKKKAEENLTIIQKFTHWLESNHLIKEEEDYKMHQDMNDLHKYKSDPPSLYSGL